MSVAGKISIILEAQMTKLAAGLKKAERGIKRFASLATKSGRLVSAVWSRMGAVFSRMGQKLVMWARRAAIAIVALGVASVKTFATFETGMAKIATLLTAQTMHLLPEFKKQIQSLAIEVGQSTTTLTAAMFDILSAQIPAQQAYKFLAQAAKTATAGFTETKTATSAMITVMKAYKMEASDAERISDVLFQTMVQGRVTFEDVAQNIGTVAAAAAIAKIDLESMATAFALMSRVLDPFRATTALRSLFAELSRVASSDQIRVAKELGIEWESASFRGDKLTATLVKLGAANEEQLGILSPNIRSLAGLATAIQEASDSARTFQEISDAGGSVARAYAISIETLGFEFNRMKEAMLALMRSAVEPFAKAILGNFESMANALRDNQEEVFIWSSLIGRNLRVLIKFIKTDFTGAMQTAVAALIEVFKGFGASLSIIMEDIFVTLGANFFVWIRKGMRARTARDLVLKELSEEYLGATGDFLRQAFDASWGGPGARVLNAPTFDEAVLQRTKLKLEQLTQASGELEFKTISMGDTLGKLGDVATSTAKNIAGLYKTAGSEAGLKFITRAQVEAERLAEQWAELFTLMTKGLPPAKVKVEPDAPPIDDIKKVASTWQLIWQETATTIASSMGDAFADIVEDTSNATQSIISMLRSIQRAMSQAVFRNLLQGPIFSGIGALTGTTALNPNQAPATRNADFVPAGGSHGGFVHAFQKGGFVPRGGDTVPAMLTPGEFVVPRNMAEGFGNGGGGGGVTINVSAIGPADTFQFLNQNKRAIASMMQEEKSTNHPNFRGRR